MISLHDLRQRKAQGKRFSCLTCYDASMAKAMEVAQIDSILIVSESPGLMNTGSSGE